MPTSSRTSRWMQSSIVSPGSTKPASALYIPGGKAGRAREQHLAAARDQHHHRRRHARIRDVAARRALLRALAGLVARRRSAAAAEAMRAVPFDDLGRARGDREQRLGQLEEERAQAGVPPARGRRRLGGEADRDARRARRARRDSASRRRCRAPRGRAMPGDRGRRRLRRSRFAADQRACPSRNANASVFGAKSADAWAARVRNESLRGVHDGSMIGETGACRQSRGARPRGRARARRRRSAIILVATKADRHGSRTPQPDRRDARGSAERTVDLRRYL